MCYCWFKQEGNVLGKPITNHFLETWGKPLCGDAPCGEDCSFSQDFESLRAEVDKDTSLHDEAADWIIISRLSADFLATQSKDIWALVYAVYAEYRINGLDACPPAFIALTQLLRTWWDDLHPSAKRPQRRLAPLQWLCGRMEHAAETTCFMDGSEETVRALREAFVALQNLLDEKTGDNAPPFRSIFSRVPETNSVQPENVPVTTSQPSEKTSSAAAPPLAASFAAMDKDGRIPPAVLPQVIRNVIDHTQQLADHFLSLNALDERAFQLRRIAIWSTLTQLPVADADGKTQLGSGIPADRIQEYTAAVEARRYGEILPSLERAAGRSPFWFDGHVMVLRCLDGQQATAAAGCMREALAAVFSRFPALLSYKFRDNTPFASSRALPLLGNLRASSECTATVGVLPAMDAAGSEERLRDAIAKGAEKGFLNGLQLLGTVPVGRSRAAIQHGLLQARYCLAMGNASSAEKLLSALYQRLDEWGLLDWEPNLTAGVLSLLLSSQSRSHSMTPEKRGTLESMMRSLHWLDLPAALTITQDN
jgi:type VI secretion system protein VasJ